MSSGFVFNIPTSESSNSLTGKGEVFTRLVPAVVLCAVRACVPSDTAIHPKESRKRE